MRRAAITAAAALGAREVVRRFGTRLDFRGKTALVAGGSRGLGFAIANELVSRGARIVICARDEERLERARTLLEARGGSVRTVRCDVGDREQVERMVADTGHVDALF